MHVALRCLITFSLYVQIYNRLNSYSSNSLPCNMKSLLRLVRMGPGKPEGRGWVTEHFLHVERYGAARRAYEGQRLVCAVQPCSFPCLLYSAALVLNLSSCAASLQTHLCVGNRALENEKVDYIFGVPGADACLSVVPACKSTA